MKNITNKGFLEYVKANFDLPAEYVEKCDAMIAQLDKNANREKKPTARQDENEVLKADVVAYLSSGVHASVSEMIKAVPSLAVHAARERPVPPAQAGEQGGQGDG